MATGRRPGSTALQRRHIDVGGVARTYLVAPAPGPGAPLLVALHGLGITGADVDRFSGLSDRAPAAGFATVFPDGWMQMWDGDRRYPRRRHIDDAAFMVALVDRLVAEGVCRPGPVSLAGVSNGAFFAERLARYAVLDVASVALVSGAATETGRQGCPRPRQGAAVALFAGTGDRIVPSGGGRIGGRGLIGMLVARRARRSGGIGPPVVAGAEAVAGDWAAANGVSGPPAVERVPGPPGDLPVTCMRWSAPQRPPVVLYRIEGGGHDWPGRPPLLPVRLAGRGARHLDATGIILTVARQAQGLGP
jgi:polyhydroxybutyrate depolymerase